MFTRKWQWMCGVAAVVSLLGMAFPAQAGTIPHGQVSYVHDPTTPPWQNGSTDNGGDQMADGVVQTVASSFLLGPDNIVEWAPNAYSPAKPAYAIMTFDLDNAGTTQYDLTSIKIDWLSRGGAGFYYDPQSIEFAFSADGSTFGAYSSAINFSVQHDGAVDNSTGRTPPDNKIFEVLNETFDVSGLAGSSVAQAVQVKINFVDAAHWFFGSEVTFDGTVVPEPGAMTLLIVGLAGLLCYAWRRRK